MNLSKKSRYGLTALIDLSIHSTKGHVSLISIAERNGISPQYLEHIFASLRRAGIIKYKGAQGGYLLGDSPPRIQSGIKLSMVDGAYKIEREEVSESENPRIALTIQNLIIDKINDRLDEVLENTTLADLESSYKDYGEYNQNVLHLIHYFY